MRMPASSSVLQPVGLAKTAMPSPPQGRAAAAPLPALIRCRSRTGTPPRPSYLLSAPVIQRSTAPAREPLRCQTLEAQPWCPCAPGLQRQQIEVTNSNSENVYMNIKYGTTKCNHP